MDEFNNQSPDANNQPVQPQPPIQPQYQQPPFQQKDPKKGLAITALVLGIVSVVLSCVIYIAVPCGIVAIVLGAMSAKSTSRGMAIAGIVLGSIGVFLSVAFIIVAVIFASSDFMENFKSSFGAYSNY